MASNRAAASDAAFRRFAKVFEAACRLRGWQPYSFLLERDVTIRVAGHRVRVNSQVRWSAGSGVFRAGLVGRSLHPLRQTAGIRNLWLETFATEPRREPGGLTAVPVPAKHVRELISLIRQDDRFLARLSGGDVDAVSELRGFDGLGTRALRGALRNLVARPPRFPCAVSLGFAPRVVPVGRSGSIAPFLLLTPEHVSVGATIGMSIKSFQEEGSSTCAAARLHGFRGAFSRINIEPIAVFERTLRSPDRIPEAVRDLARLCRHLRSIAD